MLRPTKYGAEELAVLCLFSSQSLRKHWRLYPLEIYSKMKTSQIHSADTIPSRHIRTIATIFAISFAFFLQGCAQPEHGAIRSTSQSAAIQVVSRGALTKKALIPATGPGSGTGLANYGAPLSSVGYRALVLGNTIFRPLANGGRTMIYFTAKGMMRIRLVSPKGTVIDEFAKQLVMLNGICWILSVPKPLCFIPYWNGRLLTLASKNHTVLPAQFLVQQGNPEHL